jgi:hypothetical protein
LACKYTNARGINYTIVRGRVTHKYVDIRDADGAGALFGLDPNGYVEDILPIVKNWPEGRAANLTRPGGELGRYTLYFDCLRNGAGPEFIFFIGFGSNIKINSVAIALRENIGAEEWERWRLGRVTQVP